MNKSVLKKQFLKFLEGETRGLRFEDFVIRSYMDTPNETINQSTHPEIAEVLNELVEAGEIIAKTHPEAPGAGIVYFLPR
ncbi:hypothetical protein [Neisseria sp. 74A18]|uniref:hypothetical protein n=1 Tax=Neisseria sp. 74A18 TaxID=1696094 RepID=UPI0006CAE258|nr:hypothetical protein [Neisseria sp. 74A18]KPN73673.1 hypothetical protein AKG43_06685 [Neisseria sp. 74A18]